MAAHLPTGGVLIARVVSVRQESARIAPRRCPLAPAVCATGLFGGDGFFSGCVYARLAPLCNLSRLGTSECSFPAVRLVYMDTHIKSYDMHIRFSRIVLCALLLLASPSPALAGDGLTADEAAAEAARQLTALRQADVEANRRVWTDSAVVRGTFRMPLLYKIFGTAPSDGRSLYISMHGGGNTPAAVNDQQWRNQIALYAPAEGVYVAPRAPFDDWNMWFRPQMDGLFGALIWAAVCEQGVNPDKVYLLGYSAGGDGVWRMAPRMADRWAAASMMAGHPGESSQVNLLHVPYMIWMGALDSAYSRNALAARRAAAMDSLAKTAPGGYVHATHILPAKGHWMDRADTAAIAWMARFRRTVNPRRVVWRQEQVVRPALYWLEVDVRTAREGMRVDATVRDNRVELERCDYPRLTICLNDVLADLDRPVTVVYRGRTLFSGRLRRNAATIARTVRERRDPGLVYCAEVTVSVPQ